MESVVVHMLDTGSFLGGVDVTSLVVPIYVAIHLFLSLLAREVGLVEALLLLLIVVQI